MQWPWQRWHAERQAQASQAAVVRPTPTFMPVRQWQYVCMRCSRELEDLRLLGMAPTDGLAIDAMILHVMGEWPGHRLFLAEVERSGRVVDGHSMTFLTPSGVPWLKIAKKVVWR